MPAASSKAARRSTKSAAKSTTCIARRRRNGEQTKSEALGHQEFILTYKSFEPLGPGLLSVRGVALENPLSLRGRGSG